MGQPLLSSVAPGGCMFSAPQVQQPVYKPGAQGPTVIIQEA